MSKINIKDESGDKKYFTQIPNMIVNHSTAYEQSLYLIMKRLAGENGSCFASLNFLSQKMGVNRKTVAKNIDKLLKRKWVAEIKPVKIRGGKVRQFIIIDLWKLNINEYKSGAKKDRVEVGLLFPEVGLLRTLGGAMEDTKKNSKKNKEEYSSSKKPYYHDLEMRKAQGKWWVLPKDGGQWLEFAGKESEIEWK